MIFVWFLPCLYFDTFLSNFIEAILQAAKLKITLEPTRYFLIKNVLPKLVGNLKNTRFVLVSHCDANIVIYNCRVLKNIG